VKILSAITLLLACCPLLPAQTPSRPAITGIAFFRMYGADQDASAKLYQDDMGFVRTKADGRDVYSVNDAQWFEVLPLQGSPTASRLVAVGFTTRDEKGLEAYMRAHGQTILPEKEPGSFGVKDPEGNLIVFVQQGLKHPGASTPAPRATSHRIIHAGFIVNDAAAENRFYQELLNFKPYWHGGKTDTSTDYISIQVPDGTDWLELMLNNPPNPSLKTMGVMNHFSLGIVNMDSVLAGLAANHCTDANCQKTQLGRDGKVQMNVFDPDFTRIEYMEFKPVAAPCCSPFVGKQPTEQEDK
jgi:catechol 2,3-dioxygenase-like lactoylglutathione lyase family enzyme